MDLITLFLLLFFTPLKLFRPSIPPSHGGGHWFDPSTAHQYFKDLGDKPKSFFLLYGNSTEKPLPQTTVRSLAAAAKPLR